MDKFKYLKVILFLLPILISCDKYEQFGYPKNVYVPQEGGSKVIIGDAGFYPIEIKGTLSETQKIGEDSIFNGQDSVAVAIFEVKADWLTLEYTQFSNILKLNIQPNTTGLKRDLKIVGYNGDNYTEIKVSQDK